MTTWVHCLRQRHRNRSTKCAAGATWNSSANWFARRRQRPFIRIDQHPTSVMVEDRTSCRFQGLNSASDTGDFLIIPEVQGSLRPWALRPISVRQRQCGQWDRHHARFCHDTSSTSNAASLPHHSSSRSPPTRRALPFDTPRRHRPLGNNGPSLQRADHVSSTTTSRSGVQAGLQPTNIDTSRIS